MEVREIEKWVVAKHPWFLKEVTTKESDNEINFYFDLDHNSNMFRCNYCNKISPVIESTYFMWRTFTKEGFNCYVYVKIPKVNCAKHGLHNVDKNKFRRLGGFISLNYSEKMLKRAMNQTV
ncbi:MAG: hypothetical protein SNJ77_03570 [Cytophagales bacterium]